VARGSSRTAVSVTVILTRNGPQDPRDQWAHVDGWHYSVSNGPCGPFLGASEPGGGVRTGEVASTSYELGKEREPLIKKLDPHLQLERIKGAVPLN
jgi:hypothetical protein